MALKGTTLAALAVLLAAAGAFGACGGDSEALTLEEYFERLAELDAEFEENTDALDAQLNEDFESIEPDDFEAASALFVDFFDEAVAEVERFVDEMDGLDPPAEIEDLHDAAVEAGREVANALEGLTETVREADSEEEFAALETDSSFEQASATFDESCVDLQDVADENEIEIDLDCGN